MKDMRTVFGIYTLLNMIVGCVAPVINFGSESAGFVVKGSATLNLSGATLENGYLCTAGGTLTTESPVECSNVIVESAGLTNRSSMIVNGTIYFGSDIVLGDNDCLVVSGGTISYNLTIAGTPFIDEEHPATPSILQGYGQWTYPIALANGSQLNVRWKSPLNTSIIASDENTLMVLEDNFSFAPSYFFATHPVTVDCNGHCFSFGGDAAGSTIATVSQAWRNAKIDLNGPVLLDQDVCMLFSDSPAILNGNGNTLSFGVGASLANDSASNITVENIVLNNALLCGASQWLLSDVIFEADTNAVRIDGSIVGSDAVKLFSASQNAQVEFGENTIITLQKSCVLGVRDGEDVRIMTWLFSDTGCCINGNGALLDLAGAVIDFKENLSLVDLRLVNTNFASFNNSDGASHDLLLSAVEWADSQAGTIFITGSLDSQSGAVCKLSLESKSPLIGDGVVQWQNAIIELRSDVVLTTQWQALDSSVVIIGNGHRLRFDGGSLSVVSGGTLTLRDVVLDDFVTSSFANSAAATFNLSNVTIKLADYVSYPDDKNRILITGPATFITGSYSFAAASGSVISGVSVLYDTLDLIDSANVSGFSFLNNGRLLFVRSGHTGDLTYVYYADATTYLEQDEFLFGATDDVAGRTLNFSGAYRVYYDGRGHSLTFPLTPDQVLSVASDTTVITQNILLAGLLPQQLSVDGSLAFGNGTIIKLYQNWTLDRGITFGSDAYAMGQEMILDLNGYTIDMSDTQSHIYLQGSTGSTLRICNGRLLNLFGSSSLQGQESTKIILQDVEIGLTRSTTEGSESYTFSNDVELEIQGNCILFGKAGRLFQNDSDASFTIASGSKLTILDGITYSHHNDGNNFVMQDRSSCLELVGGTFKASLTEGLPLTLSTGTLIVDHKSTMDVDNSDIIFDQSLQVHIRPSAAINISGHGALEYNSIP